MKKILTVTALLFCLTGSAQNKKPIQTRMDTVTVKDTTYGIFLTKVEFYTLVNIIKSLDEKPSILNKWIEENIYKKTQLIPNKELQK